MTSVTPLSVVHIASGDLWAGAEAQMFTLVKTLQNMQEVAVSVILMNHGELESRLREQGIQVAVLDETRFSSLSIFMRMVKLLKEAKPDVIHTHRFKENILGSLAAILAGKIPSIRTVHGAPEYKLGALEIHKRLIKRIDLLSGRYLQKCIIAVSDELKDYLTRFYPEAKVSVVENGIDIQTHFSDLEDHLYNLNSNNKIITVGIAGRLVPVKRIDIFIRAAHYYLNKYTDVPTVFNIYGDGPLEKELKSLSKLLDIDNHLTFKGHIRNLEEELNKLDIILITSSHEGLPMIMLEAMSCGVPIVAHAVGGIPKVLGDGEFGILIPHTDPIIYAKAIHKLAKSSYCRDQISKKAFVRVIECYSAKANAMAYLKKYNSAVI